MNDNELSDLFTIIKMEAENKEGWNYDNNTTTLLIVQRNLASLLQAILLVTDRLQKPENVEISGLVSGLVEMLEWLIDNTEKVEKNG